MTNSHQRAAARSSMRAAVLLDVGHLEVRQVPIAPPRSRDVLIRVQATGLCGTDVHIVAGHANYNRNELGEAIPLRAQPQILGHEIAGVVEEAGNDVRDLAVGDRVIVDQGRTCVSEAHATTCEYCATGDSHQCERYREHGITGLPGGFAEYLTIPAANAVALRTSIAAEEAALSEPLGCVIHSMDVLTRARARYALAGDAQDVGRRTVVIMGGGPAGLLFVQYLRRVEKFEGPLMVCEPSATRRQLAQRFGAETIDPSTGDVVARVRDWSHGRGAEIIIEASGAGAAFVQLAAMARKQATVLLYGHGHAGVDLSTMNALQFLEPVLLSPVGASGRHDHAGKPITYARALDLIESGTIAVAPLITHRYVSLDEVPSAFAADYLTEGYVKGVVLQ